MFGFTVTRDKSQVGLIQKMNQTIQNAIQGLFKVRWSQLPRRASSEYLELFHTSPRLDALDMIATDCANAEFQVYKKADLRTGKEDAEPIGDHPIYDVLENPIPDHPEFDGFMVRYLTHVYLELGGECFWIILRDTQGIPREIYPIPALWCIQIPTEAQPWYLIVPLKNTAGRSMQVDPRDVVWFKNPDVSSPYGRGRGRTEAIGDELETDEYAAKWAKTLYYNNATPEAFMTMPGATDDQLKAFKAAWNQSHQGITNSSKMGFLNFDAKLTQVQTSPRELDFNASREFLRNMINQHWQVPPEMMGVMQNSNRATAETAHFLYAKNVLSRRVIRWETAVNRQFAPMFDVSVAIKVKNLVPEDKEFNLQLANLGWTTGALTRDQWLVLNGKPAVGGELGGQYQVPMNMVTTSSTPVKSGPVLTPADQESGNVNQQAPGDDNSHPVTTTNNQPVIDTPSPARPIEDDSSKGFVKSFTDEHRKTIWKSFDKSAESTEKGYEASVKRFAATQKAAFQKAFQAKIDSGMKAKDAADRATLVAFNPKIDDALKTSLTPAWLASMQAGEDHAYLVLGKKKGKGARKDGVSPGFSVTNPKFLEWVQKYGLLKAKGMNDTTLTQLKDQIQTALQEGIEEGMSERDIVVSIMDLSDGVWGVMSESRAHVIARTESAATVNYGTVTTYKDNGVKGKCWLSTLDDRTRDDHVEADRQTVGIDEDFEVGGEYLEAPGLGEDPGNNCNCRCTVIPELEGDE